MRRRYGGDPYDSYPPRRRRGWTVIGGPFGVIGGRRYGPGYAPGYDPRYRRGYGGGGCGRDLCLLETGCCLAEGLDGSCLLLAALVLPQLLPALLRPVPGRSRAAGALLAVISTYRRTVSARRARPVCRFTPSCSSYAAEAVSRHGALRGTRLAAGRLLRCRPGAAGGADPVR